MTTNHVSLKIFLPLLAALVASIPLAIDMYLPAMTQISQYFDSDMAMVQMTLSVFLAGYAAGMMAFGPIADIYGRRPVVIFGLVGFVLGNFLIAFCSSIEQFLLLRLVQAFIGAAATVPVMGYIKMIYGDNMAKGISYVSMIMMLAPMIAPTLGVVFMGFYDWRLIFIVMGVYGIAVLLLSLYALPKVPPEPKKESLFKAVFNSYSVVFKEVKVRRFMVMVCFGALSFFAYLTAIPFVFMQVYGVSETTFGILFGLNVGMFMLASLINTRLVTRFSTLRVAQGSALLALVASIALVAANYFDLGLTYTVISLGIYLFGLMILSTNTDAMIILQFPQNTGTATGLIGIMRFGFGALAGPVLALFQTGSALPFTILILVSIVINVVMIPWRNGQLDQQAKIVPSVD